MKTRIIKPKPSLLLRAIFMFVLAAVVLLPDRVVGQTKEYATVTPSSGAIAAGLFGSGISGVNNPGNAADPSEDNYAEIVSNRIIAGLLGSGDGWLQVKFPEGAPANATTVFRISAPVESGLGINLGSLLGLVNDMLPAQLYTGSTAGSTGNQINGVTVNSTMVVDGNGDYYLLVNSPNNTTDYDGVRIQLTYPSALNITVASSLRMNVYNAFIYDGITCGDALLASTGRVTGLLNLSIGDAVVNPNYAIDGNSSNHSSISFGGLSITLASSVFQDFYFNGLAAPQDYFKVRLRLGGGSALNLNVLGNYEVRAYNGSDLVYTKKLQGALVNDVDLLGLLQGGGIVELPFGPGVQFDRVAVGINAAVGASLSSSPLEIYNVQRYGLGDSPLTCIDPEPPLGDEGGVHMLGDNRECADVLVGHEYANFPFNAVDGQNGTYSVLEATSGSLLGAGAYTGHIQLGYENTVSANTTSYLKIDIEDEGLLSSLLDGSLGGLLGGVLDNVLFGNHYFTIDVYDNPTESPILSGSSANAFNGLPIKIVQDKYGHYYVAITPGAAYRSVKITEYFPALAGAEASRTMKVYNLCYSTGPEDCEQAFATYSESNGISLDLLGIGGAGVTNAAYALTDDASTKSEIDLGAAGIGASVFQFVQYHTLSAVTDHFNLTFSVNTGSVADLSLLANIEVKAYAGEVEVFSKKLSEDVIGLDLLGLLQSGQPTIVRIAPGVAFDRIAVGKSTLVAANILSSPLYIHKIERFGATCPDPDLEIPDPTDDPFNTPGCADQLVSFEGANFAYNTIDGNNETFATLTSGTGIVAEIGGYNSHIELGYASPVDAYTTSYIRVNFEEDLLKSLLGGTLGNIVGDLLGGVVLGNHYFIVEVKDANGVVLRTGDSRDQFGDQFVKLVQDAEGRYYIAVTADEEYQSVRITHELNSLVGLNKVASMDVYNMCHETAPEFCDQARFVSFDGSGLNLSLDLIDITEGGVINPHYVIDQNTSNYSTINLGLAGIGATIYQNIYFNGPSSDTDKLRFRVQLDQPGLLNLDLIGSYRVKLYHGGDLVYNEQLQAGLLNNIDLLALFNSGGIQELTLEPGVVFDRVQFGLESIATINTGAPLRLYEVSRVSDDCPDPTFEEPPFVDPFCATELIGANNVDNLEYLFNGNHNSYATIRSDAGLAVGLFGYNGYVELGYGADNVAAGTTSYIRIDTDATLLETLLSGSLGNALSTIVGNIILGHHYFVVEVKDVNGDAVVSGSSTNMFSASNGAIKIVQDTEGRYYLAITPTADYNRVRITDNTNSIVGLNNQNSINVYGMCHEASFDACAFPFSTSFDGSGLNLDITDLGGYGVTNAYRAIDPSNTSDYSEISLGTLSVAGSVEQKIQFNKPLEANAVVKLDMAVGTGVLAADVFGRIEVVGYRYGTVVYAQDLENAVLGNVNLLDLFNNGARSEISFAPDVEVDEVGLRLRAIASIAAVPNMRLYSVSVDCTLPEFIAWKSFEISEDPALTSVLGDETVEYTIHVRNTGTVPIIDFIVTDAVPQHTTYVAGSGGTYANGIVTFENINVPVDGEETVRFRVLVNKNLSGVTEISNVALVKANEDDPGTETLPPFASDPNEPDNSGNTGTNIPVDPVYSVISWKAYKVDGDASITSVTGGETVEYTIYVRNTGNQNLTNIEISDELPAGVTHISGGNLNGNTVSFTIPTLAVDATSTGRVFTVKVDQDLTDIDVIRNVAVVSSDDIDDTQSFPPLDNENPTDPDGSGDTGTEIPVEPVHEIDIALNGLTSGGNTGPAVTGEVITYTITVENTGNKNLTGVEVSALVPDQTTFIDSDDGGTVSGDDVSFPPFDLAVGETRTFTYTIEVGVIDPGVVESIDNTATVTFRNEDDTDDETRTADHSMDTDCLPLLAGDISLSADKMIICAGESSTLTASLTDGSITGAEFLWYTNPALIGTPLVGASVTVTPSATTTYYVIVNADGYCFETPPATVTITVNPLPDVPTITFTGDAEICDGGTIELTATVGATSYIWYLNGVEIVGETTNTLITGEAGIYTVAALSGSDCVSAQSAGVTINVLPLPDQPTIDIAGSTEFCVGESLLLTSSAPEGNQWYLDGNPIAGATAQTYMAVEAGSYTVVVTGSNGCESLPSDAISLVVNVLPVITFDSNTSIAAQVGQPVSIPIVLNTDGYTLTWYDHQGQETSDLSPTFDTPGVYTYTVVAVNDAGCSSSASVLITVYGADGCPPLTSRVYTTGVSWQSLGGAITNTTAAADGNPQTSATVTLVAGLLGLGGGYVDLTFDETYTAGTPVTVKLGREYSGAGLISGVLAYGLTESGQPIGAGSSVDAGLLSLLSADAAYEFTFVPANISGPRPYKGVRLYFGSLLSVAENFKVFDAYVTEPTTVNVCEPVADGVNPNVQDVLYGVEVLLGLDALSATASVVDAWNAVDNDMSTPATIVRGVELLNAANLTVVFKNQTMPSDSLQIIMEDPTSTGLELSLLSGFRIQRYLGNTPVGDPIDEDLDFLGLKLLYFGEGKQKIILAPYPEPYDRVTISYGGLLNINLGEQVRVYDVSIAPAIDYGNLTDEVFELCQGDPLVFSPQDDCTIYAVYDEDGNTLVSSDGLTFTLPENLVSGVHTFYVQAIRQGCELGGRVPIVIHILPTPTADDMDIAADKESYCIEDSVVLMAEVDDALGFADPQYTWYFDADKLQPITQGEVDGITYTITNGELTISGLAAGNHTYYVSVREGANGCENTAGDLAEITITIDPRATSDDIADVLVNGVDPVDPLCLLPGEEVELTASLSATSTIVDPVFHWYDESGAALIDGADGTLDLGVLIPGTYTYSVGVSGDGVCESAEGDRKSVTFTINPTAGADDIADVLVNGVDPVDPLCLLPGEEVELTASLSATSTIVDPVFHWYDESGAALIDGADGTLDLGVLIPGTYTYSVGVSGDGVCESAEGDRKSVTFTINPTAGADDIADILVNGVDPVDPLCLLPGEEVELTASLSATSTIVDPVFHWYDESGAALIDGADGTLDLGVLIPGTYTYSVGVSGDGVCESAEGDRKSVTFTINPTAGADDIADILVNGVDPVDPLCLLPGEEVELTASLSATSTIVDPVFHWYDESGAALIDGADGTLDLGVLIPGTYTYSVGVSGDGVCESAEGDRKSVTFTINPTAGADDIADILVNGVDPVDPLCLLPGEEVELTASLSATSTIVDPVFHWYDESGAALIDGADGTLDLGVLIPGTYTYSVGVSGDGVCESAEGDRKSVTFTINPTAGADDIADILVNGVDPVDPLCLLPGEEVELTASLSATSTIVDPVFHWYDESGAALIDGADGTLDLGVLIPGTYTYSVGVSGDGVCESAEGDRKSVTFTINPTAGADDIADVLVNGVDPVDPLCLLPGEEVELTASLSVTSTIVDPVFHWYDESGAALIDGADGTLDLGVLIPGTYTYSVGVSGDGVCESAEGDRKSVTFTINPTAGADDIADVLVNGVDPVDPLCLLPGEEVELTASLSATSTIVDPVFHWYDESGAALIDGADGTLDLGVLIPGTYTYSVGVSGDGVCESAEGDRKSVTFTINPTAGADDIADILVNGVDPVDPLCLLPGEEVELTASLSATSTIVDPVFHWYDESGAALIDGADGTLDLGVLIPGTYTYSVGVSGDGVCESAEGDRKSVTFMVNSIADSGEIGDVTVIGADADGNVCIDVDGNVTLLAVLHVDSEIQNPIFHWYDEAGTIISGGEDGELVLNDLTPGTYTYYVGVSGDNVCETLEDDRTSVTFTARICADLEIVKTVDNIAPFVGSNVVFTLVVTNNGPSDATGVVVQDELPSGYEYVSSTVSEGAFDAASHTWTVGTLANGASETLTITARVLAAGDYINYASVDGNEDDPDEENNEDTPDDPVVPIPVTDLEIVKKVDNIAPFVGSNVVFTVVVTNNGPSDAAGVVVTDELPSGYEYVSSDATIGAFDAASHTWTVGGLANGVSQTLTITARVLAAGDYINYASVDGNEDDPDEENNEDTPDDPVVPVPVTDLEIVKTVDNIVPFVGSNVVFTVVVTNNGPSDATGVVVRDELPSGYEYVSSMVSEGAFDAASHTWTVGDLANGASQTLTITARVLAAGDYINYASVDGNEGDPDEENNEDTPDDPVVPVPVTDLEIVKTVDNIAPFVGSNVVFTVVVTNNGPSDATGVVVRDELPSGYEYVSSMVSEGAFDAASHTWTVGGLANGASETLTITARVLAAGDYINYASVEGNEGDPDEENNEDTPDDPVVPIPVTDLEIVKTVDNIAPFVGSNVMFTVVVTNNGPSDATGVVVRDELPSGYEYVSSTVSEGAFDAASHRWTVGTLANGASETLTITARVLAAGDYINYASVDGNEDDPDEENNEDTPDDPVVPAPVTDLEVIKTVDNIRPEIGSDVVFTVVVTNNGPSDATGVVVRDELPSGYEYVSSTVSEGAFDAASHTWTVGGLANGTSETLTITARVLTEGDYINYASVGGNEDDPDEENNEDTPDEEVIPVYSVVLAVDDEVILFANDEVTIDVLENDIVTLWQIDPSTVAIMSQSGNGSTEVLSTGEVLYTPNFGYVGDDSFTYRVQDEDGRYSNVARVSITVQANLLQIPNVITPNGDGINDQFVIVGREAYDRIELTILNRMGNEVYRNDNYRDEWDGIGLYDGTYYYFVRLYKGDVVENRKGNVLIKRH